MTEMNIVGKEEIISGRATDAYFDRTVEALAEADRNPRVVAEVTADQFPDGEFEVLAGLPGAAEILAETPVSAVALPEGQLFDGGPVMRISGPYRAFARYETALLGVLSHASGMATAALETVRAADDVPVVSFGARHVHPAIAGVVERSALVGGVSGISHVAAAERLDRDPSGTMPHALVLAFGRDRQERAWRAFDDAAPEDTPRIAICDTFDDEVSEVRRAVAELGESLDGVRLDTTGSRRGDFEHIVREVRWELARLGREDVDVFVSGGLGPGEVRSLRDVVDGFGVGGYVSNADPVDFALDVVEVDGESVAKRGKLPGATAVDRAGGEHRVRPDGPGVESLLEPFVEGGEAVREFDVDAAAHRARRDAERVGFRVVE